MKKSTIVYYVGAMFLGGFLSYVHITVLDWEYYVILVTYFIANQCGREEMS